MRHSRWIKFGSLFALLVSIGIFHLALPEVSTRLWSLIVGGDVAALVDFLRSFGAWAMVISVVIDVIINATGVLPSIVISTANGILFGIVPGILISWIAECMGVTISFLLMRGLFRDEAKKLVDKSSMLKKVDELSGRNGFRVMLLARMVPYFPSGIITALGALSSISLKDYIFANLIGKLPSTALEVVIGYDIVNYQENSGWLSVIAILLASAYGINAWLNNRRKRRSQEEN
ncbi:SNARE-like domain protein [Anaerosporomusa subterranea]|uniref:TVP38/TMEM64 family membrane protein n=1 Tax=Anaerosporomusa subterranea TaxID=1794912 RepID=A0A154BLT2_ANASB|nr:TVP38/TMEM64 family protein [Anaerosporomusa subterranea]KYZ74882.1 SNARE-like domain protein [Anaerosporomusa subterranea]